MTAGHAHARSRGTQLQEINEDLLARSGMTQYVRAAR